MKNSEKWFRPEGSVLEKIVQNRIIIRDNLRINITNATMKKYGLKIESQLFSGYATAVSEGSIISFDTAATLIENGYYVEYDTHVNFLTSQDPNDFYYAPSGLYQGQWSLTKIGMPAAWLLVDADPSIVVAVIDSGLDYAHPDLVGNLYHNLLEIPSNGIDDDHNGKIDDVSGWDFFDNDNDPKPYSIEPEASIPHGTNVAGIIAGMTDNGIGVAGVAGGWGQPGASLMTLRINTAYMSQVIESVLYAVRSGAHVVNMSWGKPSSIQSLEELFVYLSTNYDSVLVAAAGNDPDEPVSFPAAYSSTIAVGTSTMNDEFANDSNGPELDLVAPSRSILTDVLGLPGTPLANLMYYWDYHHGVFSLDYTSNFTATSSATPLVSGAVALMLASNPGLSPVQIRDALRASCDQVPPYNYNWNPNMPGQSKEMGYGRLRVDNALGQADQQPTLVLQSLVAGSIVLAESNVQVSWNRNFFTGPVNVELYNSLGLVMEIATNITGSILVWHNDGNLVTDHDYRIKVTASNHPEIFDFSDRPFTLEGISLVNIPDVEFLRVLVGRYDINVDHRIDVNEANQIISLDINAKAISDLSGLEMFTNLKSLNCSYNEIVDMTPVLANTNFMERCDKSIDFRYNLLDVDSPVGVCELSCSTWVSFLSEYQLDAFNCACWNPPCGRE